MKLVGIVHEKHGSEEFKQFFNGPLFLDKQVVIRNSKYASALSAFKTVVFMTLFLQGMSFVILIVSHFQKYFICTLLCVLFQTVKAGVAPGEG